jgi:hypothetical protein
VKSSFAPREKSLPGWLVSGTPDTGRDEDGVKKAREVSGEIVG